MTDTVLGIICLKMIRAWDAPRDRTARIYSFSFSLCGAIQLVSEKHDGGDISTIYKESGSEDSIGVSSYSQNELEGMFLGRYYPGKEEIRLGFIPSDKFEKYKPLLEEAGLWEN